MPVTATLADRLLSTRSHSEALCQPLQTEDYVVQPIEDVSPPKWHLGHTTWFFEEFVLKPFVPGYSVFHDDYAFVFNSYYESLGERVIRANRGNLSRPSVQGVYKYRRHVTEKLMEFLEGEVPAEACDLVEVGIHHEQQHQELLLTDIKYILGNNPLLPAYSDCGPEEFPKLGAAEWITVPGGHYDIGHRGEGFCFDNELGRHQVLLGLSFIHI